MRETLRPAFFTEYFPTSIGYRTAHRFLGVIVDPDLTCSYHVSHMKQYLVYMSNLFKFLAVKSWSPSMRSMFQLYTVLILGFLQYSVPLLSYTHKTSLILLQSVQAPAFRTCLGVPKCSSAVATIVIARERLITTHIVGERLRPFDTFRSYYPTI